MRYWWANQTQTYRQQFGRGYFWSPNRNANLTRNPFYETMPEVAPGDLISSFVDTQTFAIGIAQSYCWSPKPTELGSVGPAVNRCHHDSAPVATRGVDVFDRVMSVMSWPQQVKMAGDGARHPNPLWTCDPPNPRGAANQPRGSSGTLRLASHVYSGIERGVKFFVSEYREGCTWLEDKLGRVVRAAGLRNLVGYKQVTVGYTPYCLVIGIFTRKILTFCYFLAALL